MKYTIFETIYYFYCGYNIFFLIKMVLEALIWLNMCYGFYKS